MADASLRKVGRDGPDRVGTAGKNFGASLSRFFQPRHDRYGRVFRLQGRVRGEGHMNTVSARHQLGFPADRQRAVASGERWALVVEKRRTPSEGVARAPDPWPACWGRWAGGWFTNCGCGRGTRPPSLPSPAREVVVSHFADEVTGAQIAVCW